MRFRNRVRDKRAAERRRHERVACMKAEHWSRVNVRGIAPYTIDRVEGTYTVEFDRTGRRLPVGDWHSAPIRAYDVRLTDGTTRRFARLKDAKAWALEQRLARAGIVYGT